MTSTGRAFANRRNAKRSTGPRTVEGKKRVSSNAVKHGLSIHLRHTSGGPEVEALAAALVGKLSSPLEKKVAYELAERTFALKRFQEFKLSLLEVDDGAIHAGQNSGPRSSNAPPLKMMRTLPMLAKLQRYEQRIQSQQWRAMNAYVTATDGIEEI